MINNLRRKRIRVLSWFLYGLGAFIGLDGLYMQLSGFSASQGPSVFLFIWNLTLAQDMLIFAIAFGVVATVFMIASFRVKETSRRPSSRGTGTTA